VGCQGNSLRLLHFNVTLLNPKAISYFADMPAEVKPDIISMVETHLLGASLNRTRRVMQKCGWRMFSTPALPKHERDARTGEAHPSVQQTPGGTYHNIGGEAVLMDPSRKASGYHQAKEHFGFRSVLVRMKGWTLHYIAAYVDSEWPFEVAGHYSAHHCDECAMDHSC